MTHAEYLELTGMEPPAGTPLTTPREASLFAASQAALPGGAIAHSDAIRAIVDREDYVTTWTQEARRLTDPDLALLIGHARIMLAVAHRSRAGRLYMASVGADGEAGAGGLERTGAKDYHKARARFAALTSEAGARIEAHRSAARELARACRGAK